MPRTGARASARTTPKSKAATPSSSTRRKSRTAPSKRRVSAVQEELSKRKEPSRPKRRGKSSRRATVTSSDRTIILAMSPKMANYLRVVLNRARHDEPAINALIHELESQLDNRSE